MNEAPRLYQLQMIDLDLDEKRRQLQQAQDSLGESEALHEARARLEAAEHQAKDLQLRLRQTEKEVDVKGTKIADLQKRLFGGAVGKQKEAHALEKELQALTGERSALEDQLLDLMAEAETQPDTTEEARRGAAEAERAWREEQTEIAQRVPLLQGEIARLEEERARLIPRVSNANLRIYEDLRRTLHGRAVARVERNTCLGCRVGLPTNEVQRVRNSQDISLCSFCGRILYLQR